MFITIFHTKYNILNRNMPNDKSLTFAIEGKNGKKSPFYPFFLVDFKSGFLRSVKWFMNFTPGDFMYSNLGSEVTNLFPCALTTKSQNKIPCSLSL